jgi:hypothetical protein
MLFHRNKRHKKGYDEGMKSFNELIKPPLARIIISFAIGWMLILLGFFALSPLISFSEIERQSPLVAFIMMPMIGACVLFSLFVFGSNLHSVKFGRWLLFPLILISYTVWFILFMFTISAVSLWFTFFMFPVWIFGIPLTIIIGLFIDLKSKKKIVN